MPARFTKGVAPGVGSGLLVGALGIAGRRTGVRPAERAAWSIPIGRFTGLVVTAITGVRLSRARTRT